MKRLFTSARQFPDWLVPVFERLTTISRLGTATVFSLDPFFKQNSYVSPANMLTNEINELTYRRNQERLLSSYPPVSYLCLSGIMSAFSQFSFATISQPPVSISRRRDTATVWMQGLSQTPVTINKQTSVWLMILLQWMKLYISLNSNWDKMKQLLISWA